ncbi:hypothetical protein Nepgr_021910 [Nepenthes gracilis]|uniref:Uncharacterized protein n=1 Tax=Nepenthes gracilis TaxID=150966 RepID=A0AAD3XXI5_NEPGR|nr:hypothetical protein Nepgr_021910 [Nepenthes gracilis]
MPESMWLDDASAPSTSTSQLRRPSSRNSANNVFRLLAHREVAPQTKRSTKRLWEESSKGHFDSYNPRRETARDANHGLLSWVEADSLRHLSAKYCPLLPPPRSTIAAAFSPDGKTLASTHGDHTVKIIDFYTGNCLKVLSGHRRTPWVVRFHPICPEILASGSLDHEVRLWDATTAECIRSRDFYRPIASIAFHAQGELLAVASGHKLYIWQYNGRGETSSPTIVLKTRRSLRAVQFHPHAAPFLLTAEVNDLDSSDSIMAVATSQGYLRYPPPTICFASANSSDRSSLADELPLISLPLFIWPSFSRDDGMMSMQDTDGNISLSSALQRLGTGASARLLTYSTPSGQYELLLSPIEANSSSPVHEVTRTGNLSSQMETAAPEPALDAMEIADVQPDERNNQFFPFGDPTYWELPFLQGWLIGQSQAERRLMRPLNPSMHENSPARGEMPNLEPLMSAAMPIGAAYSRSHGRFSSRFRPSRPSSMSSTLPIEGASLSGVPHEESDSQPVITRIQSELATSLTAAAAAELPCTVKLRIWPHDIKDPCQPLDTEILTIEHAVLCSEMGSHFSPCGRFLAACVACMLPHVEGDHGLQPQAQQDVTRAASSPTRHPIFAHQVMYELRIYSLEKATFGWVLASRAIRAAHCLTSIQFSPTSEHLLLAYGRRHNSLLKSVVIDGETTIPIYTILEVYRVRDMELVRVLPSAEDEVNVACFHPSVGGGIVYGTKEGRLRILQYDSTNNLAGSCYPDESMLEVPTYALEC